MSGDWKRRDEEKEDVVVRSVIGARTTTNGQSE